MTITERFARIVSETIKRRGQRYFTERRVWIYGGDPLELASLVEADVKGSDNYYDVSIQVTDEGLIASCDCPYFEDRLEVCKHVWAVMLAADAKHLLSDALSAPPRIDCLPEADDDSDYEFDRDDYYAGQRSHYRKLERERNGKTARGGTPAPTTEAVWKSRLSEISEALANPVVPATGQTSDNSSELLYIIDVEASSQTTEVIVELATRRVKRNGEWTKPVVQGFDWTKVRFLSDIDARIISLLRGSTARSGSSANNYYSSYFNSNQVSCRYGMPHPLRLELIPMMCETGRCWLRISSADQNPSVLRWDSGPPWEFELEVRPSEGGDQVLVTGLFKRESERIDITATLLLAAGGLAFFRDRVVRVDERGCHPLLGSLIRRGPLQADAEQAQSLLQQLLELPIRPTVQLPDDLKFEEVRVTPRPRLIIRKANASYSRERLVAELSLDYAGMLIHQTARKGAAYDPKERKLIVRDPEVERRFVERLRQAGFRVSAEYRDHQLELTASRLPGAVKDLVAEGWAVEAEGKLYRKPGRFQMGVTSGIDWFDLTGKLDYDGLTVSLPDLLTALRRGESTVRLDDGTLGILPDEWLKRYMPLADIGEADGASLRFKRSQAGLLDAMLAAMPEVDVDQAFNRAREALKTFERVEPRDAAGVFTGTLRDYQKDGLGWLHFLQQFGFGGCLADDMGLGKTVQVLALLESRRKMRAEREATKKRTRTSRSNGFSPSLVVVPRSLVFNWKQEAARFTPRLKVLDHTGADRARECAQFNGYDLIITTYGILRRDAPRLKDQRFDYIILDEAQAIKNASSESAKAARLLQGDYRLAMSGTPVENHLGELWSLFEFLNPGVLGAGAIFQAAAGRSPTKETIDLLARGLRPFILRRTKEQVAKDLPPRLEQTIYCDLEDEQRRLYDQLRKYYRDSLLAQVDRVGLARTKIQVLEALLRLRQTACHPGLVDKSRSNQPSAKLDVLIPRLKEVVEEGHKALVFSQFTSLLAILRRQLDRDRTVYEYLDGRTRDREAKVERFQNDPKCSLFLISLKAGGLGLNLTAADYVFLLDPWWNPAIEAQAIDRTHRIGQIRQVFAYRLIARDTVEEKVVDIQERKRELADAIIRADNSLIRSLEREDLELLLS